MEKEVCFNELSTLPLCVSVEEVDQRVIQYGMTLKVAGTQGIKKVRYAGDLTEIPLSETHTLQDYCNSNMRYDVVQLILSMATKPQVPGDNLEILGQYLETETTILKEDDNLIADGFNAAFCMGTYCVGFASEPFWDTISVNIRVKSNDVIEDHVWFCVSSPPHFEDASFIDWQLQFMPVVLLQTTLLPVEKQMHLLQHHGKDKLAAHAKSLLNSPYVEGVLTSLPFKRQSKSYVLKNSDFAHGIIDIVLFWEEEGYSMRMKTTGRDIRETLKIAELLTRKYGRR